MDEEIAVTRSVEIPEKAVEMSAQAMYHFVEGQHAPWLRSGTTGDYYRDEARAALTAALPYLAPAEPKDTRTEEEKGFVEIALNAVDAGNAGSWPTVAGYLADEVRRLRATPAGDGGLREALEQALESPVELWHENSFRVKALPETVLRELLAAHPAAPAVPQPVDREALADAVGEVWPWDDSDEQARDLRNDVVDAVLAVLAGEQEQVET